MSRRNKRKSKGKSPNNKFKTQLKTAIRTIFKKNDDIQLDYKTISNKLEIKDSNTRKLVLSALLELKDEGFLNEISRGIFALNLENTNIVGTVDASARRGAYILIDGREDDVFVAAKNLSRALHGDTVKIELIGNKNGKAEGKVVEIVDRKTQYFVGTIALNKKFAFLVTDNHKVQIDLFIPLDKLMGAKEGDKVLGRITSWPKGVDNPFGEVVEVLGATGENNAEMLGILLKNDLSHAFPQEVLAEAETVGMDLDEAEIKQRRDMRGVLTFTIDPFDAKDFDDALSFQQLENGNFEIGIHIADVSHYVRPGTAMDKEAQKRGNSTYLVDRVVSMLPEQLSNMACSLRPNEDKYTFSVVLEMDTTGKIYNEWFGKTVIHSDYRFAYEDAQDVIEGKSDVLKHEIITLNDLAKLLRKKRMKNGALSIESEEVRFKLDDNGNPVEVVHKVSKDAHKLIEEFMLLANRKVAEFVGKIPGKKEANTNFVYRVHDKPDVEKIQTFAVFIDKFGYDIHFDCIEGVSKALNSLFAQTRNTPEHSLIQSMAIRSMAKATYETLNIGHYGLAFDFYTHFTSPIRRYADLVVHRLLMDKLSNKVVNYGPKLQEICKHISTQERKSVDAERESNKFFQAKFVADKVGEIFEGTVSGLADFGLFVRMTENYCEGMVSMNDIPNDNFYFDNKRFAIVGRNHGDEYNFGDKVKVKIINVDAFKRQIDLEIV